MWYICYDVNIHYKEGATFNVRKYSLFARDEDNARNIAEELFYVEVGKFLPQQVLVKPHIVSTAIKKEVLRIAENYYKELSSALNGKDYRSFLDSYLAYNGFGLTLGNKPRFLLKLNTVCVKVDFDVTSCVSQEFVRVVYDDRTYVVKDLKDVFIARGE